MSSSAQFEFRPAMPCDALCLSALATQVFFDTYATAGINSDLANEAKEHYSEEAYAKETLNYSGQARWRSPMVPGMIEA